MTTITIGLDGANWDLVDEWLSNGKLPNLQRLVESGVGGISESCLPPITVPNWKVYATGKNPGKLDVFRFDRIDTGNREHVFHDAADFKSAELWDYLNDGGYSTGVINMPTTYPPKDLDGFMVAGGPDASENEFRSLDRGFAKPERVERFLKEELDYRIHPSPMISPTDTGQEEIEAVLDLIEKRFEAATRLLERENPDFLHLTIFYSMALQHYFWREDPVYRAWKVMDRNLGRFLDSGHDLILVSDHGTWHVETVFYINVWLEQQGYLTTDSGIDEVLWSLGLTRERALSVAKRLGMVDTLSKVVPERIQNVIPWNEGVKHDRVLSVIDWDATQAIASNQGPIYLNVDDETEYERVRQELIDQLSSLTHPRTDAPVVNDVYRGEKYYSGPFAENAPDLLLDQGPNVHTSDAVGPDTWHSSSGVWKGGNMPEGIFLMSGPSFSSEGLTKRARLVDIAPTILHAMGVAVPNDVDGRVLDVFAPGSDPARRDVAVRDPLGIDRTDGRSDGHDVEQRLADLGYLE